MAVSGRKQTDVMLSLKVSGSTEDFDHKCEPCFTMDEQKEAQGFCVPCQEYLCKTCRNCHKNTKALRNHEIIGRDQFNKIQTRINSNDECIEQCSLHEKEIIKFYCQNHASLGCNDCMTISHRTCKIDYIPEKSFNIADGKEYNDIMMKLSEKLNEAEEISERAKSSNCDINEVNKEIINKIAMFRAEINDRLDQMQQDILNDVEGKTSNNKEIVQKVINTCDSIISDVKKLQSSLLANKSSNQNGQLYIDIKRAESKLKQEELKEAKYKLMNMNIHYSFRRNADFESMLSKKNVFGDVIKQEEYAQQETEPFKVHNPFLISTKKRNTMDHLTLKNNINVKTGSDEKVCRITGCSFLSPNEPVLADCNNKKVKMVSVKKKLVIQEEILEFKPWDVVVMYQNLLAVTMPDGRRIDLMTIAHKFSLFRSMKVEGKCYGIIFCEDRLYVACSKPFRVVVLTTQGEVIQYIPLNFLSSYCYPYIAVKKDSSRLYISDYSSDSVLLPVDISRFYLQGPKGMCLIDDGSLLIISYSNNGTITKVGDDLKEKVVMCEDIAYPNSICYSAYNSEIYVGCDGDRLKVLNND